MSSMDAALKILRLLQIALISSIFLYILIGEMLGSKHPVTGISAVVIAMLVMAALTVVIVVVLHKVVVGPAATTLTSNADDATALMRWRTGNIVLMALCESIALYGFVLRFLGYAFTQALPLYLAAIVLMLYCGPKRPGAQ